MEMLIPITNTKRLKEIGCPFAKQSLYNIRYYNRYPGLVVKVGRVLCLNVEKLKEMIELDVKFQEIMGGKLEDILKDKYFRWMRQADVK